MQIGIIGAGAVARLHAVAAERLGLRLTAVCDLRQEAARAVAADWGARTTTDYRRLLDDPEVDAVIVNTPHALHRQMVLDAAAAGRHVLVEKPMATTVEDCLTMEAACRSAGVALVVGMIQHFLPEKVALEKVVNDGELGRVLAVQDLRSTDYRPSARPAWFFDPAVSGGGALMNIGAHCLDRALWLGGARAESIRAKVLDRFAAGVETDGRISLTLANGVDVSIGVVSDCPEPVDRLLLVCEGGTLLADARRGTFLRKNGHTRVLHEYSNLDIQNAFTSQMADFCAAIAGVPSLVSNEHARHVVEVVLQAYQSAATGQTLTLQPA